MIKKYFLILPCVLASKPDAIILDPFFGAGTTGLVAMENGRTFVGVQINEQYCEIAKNRIVDTKDDRGKK